MNISKRNEFIQSEGRKIRVAVYSPETKRSTPAPGILWLHGGGYATGFPEMFHLTRAKDLCRDFGCIVVMPDYTLSWKEPFPAAFEDGWNSLIWMQENAASLGIDPKKLAIGGESAGGGLCVALCLKARDTGLVDLKFQLPLYPMLSDTDTPSSRDNHAPVWNTRNNHMAWKMYLKGCGERSKYAAPSRETDYSGLPPCYTYFGEDEPFLDEDLAYVKQLEKAGVPVHWDLYPHWFHAYDLFFPKNFLGRVAGRRFHQNVRKLLEGECFSQKNSQVVPESSDL